MPLTVVWTVLGTACAAALLGCSSNPLPGTMLGTYSATGTLATNTCGSGLGAPSPWTFSVQMSEQGTTLYWSWMDGSPADSTVLSSPTQATLTATQTANVDGTPDGGAGPCWMTRDDSVGVTLASGSPPPTFTATIGYAFSVASGATCTDQLSSNGGMYDTLPCSTSYAVTATLQ